MQRLLFSTDTDSGTVTVFDMANTRDPISKIQIGNGPRGAVRFTKDGRGFVTNHAGNTLSEIDAYSLRETSRIVVGIAPIGLAIVKGDKYAIVSNSGDNTLSIVDLQKRREAFVLSIGREPRHPDVTPDGSYAFVPLSGGDSIAKIDISSLLDGQEGFEKIHVVTRIFLGTGTMPYSAAVSPDGKHVVAANNQATFVTVLESATGAIEHKVDLGTKGARGTTFTPDSAFAFVSIEDTSEIAVIDLGSGNIVQRLPTGPGPRGLFYDEPTMTIFGSCFSRTGAGAAMIPNSVTALQVGASPLNLSGAVPVTSLSVGAGPCSVSLFER